MTVPRLEEMAEYWREYPPLNEEFARFAQYFGMKKSEAPGVSGEDQNDQLFQELMAGGFSFDPGIL